MINIFVTYRCNLACSYCFARELQEEHPVDLQEEAFRKLLQWMKGAALPAVAFLGGEPTLHERLAEMVEGTAAAGVSVVLFTNGLFPRPLVDRLAGGVANFVVNFNDPRTYTAKQEALLHANLARLADLGARITFSKNFSANALDYGYLLEGAARYGVRFVRYDLTRPSGSAVNSFVTAAEARSILTHLVGFVRQCEARNIRTGLDCCVRLCDVTAGERRYLEGVAAKFTGICHPSVDIHPDLSASYCLPLRDVHVPDVTRFTSSQRLVEHFSAMVRPVRFEGVETECRECPDFMRFCQGGCMALKRPAPVAALRGPAQGVEGGAGERD